VSVVLEFVSVPEREMVAPVLLSWSEATPGRTVPVGAVMTIVPGPTSPPSGELVVNEKEYLTCWALPAVDDTVGAVTPETVPAAFSVKLGLATGVTSADVEALSEWRAAPGFVTSSRVIVTVSPGLIVSVQQR
jgi:hypothetical protein